MSKFIWLALAAILFSGCATSTVDKRKQERYAAYASLSPEFKSAVDKGHIMIGMPMDAVYIAWGKPAQVLQSTSAQGSYTTWLYQGSQLKQYNYWGYGAYRSGRRYWGQPYMTTSYYSLDYVSAEVIFEQGVLKEWRTLPAPP